MRLLLALLLLAGACPAQTVTKLALCDLLSDPARYHSQWVEVTGPVSARHPLDHENDNSLDGEACASGFTRENNRVSKIVGLVSSAWSTGTIRPGFKWDDRSERFLSFALASIDPARQQLQVTVVGIFETKIPLAQLQRPYIGFGHLNAMPAQILVQRVTDIRLVNK